MLGALDSVWEREENEPVPLETFAGWRADLLHQRGAGMPFSQLTYDEALAQFQRRQVLTPDAFAALDAGLKRQAFAIAGLAQTELVEEAHNALERMLRDSPSPHGGPNLRDFQAFARDHLESAGWTPANPSHVETVYRTNIASAYSTGRFVEMRQPEVMKARPYWQIFSVRDSRSRPAHAAAHGTILPADDPFWAVAYPPFGYNCRCRAVSRSQRWMDANGATVGARPAGLPDPGFDSGTTALPGATEAVAETEAQQPAQAAPPAPPPPPGPVVGPAPPERPATPRPSPPVPSAAGGGMAPPEPPVPPAPPAPPPGGKPPSKKAFAADKVEFDGNFKRISAFAERLFGEFSPQIVHDIVGIREAFPGVTPAVTVTDDAFGRITVRSMNQFASVERTFKLNARGELEVVNGAFYAENQDTGAGKRMLKAQLRRNIELGVKRASLEAASIGQYLWPRMGYRLSDPGQLVGIKAEFEAWLAKEAVVDVDVASITSLHEISIAAVGERRVGKEFLVHRGLTQRPVPMEMSLDPGSPELKIAKNYVGL